MGAQGGPKGLRVNRGPLSALATHASPRERKSGGPHSLEDRGAGGRRAVGALQTSRVQSLCAPVGTRWTSNPNPAPGTN